MTTLRCRIAVATRAHADAVFDVRRAAYRAAPEFDWKDEAALAWNDADDTGTVLGLWDEHGTLLSTMRATAFGSRAAAEAYLEYSLDGAAVGLPTLVFSRAATRPDAARHGLFARMRAAYLAALPATPLQSLAAIVYEGGPRLRSMADAGYAFTQPRAGWDSEAVARSAPLLAVLPRSRFGDALAWVRAGAEDALAATTIDVNGIARAFAAQCGTTPAR